MSASPVLIRLFFSSKKFQIFLKIMLDKWITLCYYMGVAKDSRCLQDINPAEVRLSFLIVCVSYCLLAGRHFFIFGGENYAQRKGS